MFKLFRKLRRNSSRNGRSEDLQDISKEMRTSLTSIIGYTDAMLLGMDGNINEEMREDMEAIIENSNNMLSSIKKLFK